MKSLREHFLLEEDEFNKKIVEIEGIPSSNEFDVPSSSSFGTSPRQASTKFSGKSKKNKKNKKFWKYNKYNQNKNWTGVYDSGKFILITMKEDDLPQTFLERLTSNRSSWEKFKTGSEKLETLSRIIRNETLLVKISEDFIPLELPLKTKSSLSKSLSKREEFIGFIGESLLTTIWRKQGRISFNLSIPMN